MKQSHKFAVGVVASLGLGIAVATAYANPGQMSGGMGPQGGMQHGGMVGMQHGGMGSGAAGHGVWQQLITPEERTALMEKMHNAATPEERQKIAEATRAEMQKRAKEKGITLPAHRGPHFGGTPRVPATN